MSVNMTSQFSANSRYGSALHEYTELECSLSFADIRIDSFYVSVYIGDWSHFQVHCYRVT